MVAARDADYAGFIWYPQLPALDHWLQLYQRAARANGGEPDAGRRLLSWARQAGFADITPTGSMWCYATDEMRAWWGGMWADRILRSDLSAQLLGSGMASAADLEAISQAWRDWAAAPDGWLGFPTAKFSAGCSRRARRSRAPGRLWNPLALSPFMLVNRVVLAFSFLQVRYSSMDDVTQTASGIPVAPVYGPGDRTAEP
ncbi:putative methyltransferase, partial [Mycobacterium ulcerans str. Harvey]